MHSCLRRSQITLSKTKHLFGKVFKRMSRVLKWKGKKSCLDLAMDEWTIKTPNLTCQLYFKIDLLTDIVALCLTDFIDWRYIHSVVCIFDPACELLPPWTKEQYLCTDCCPSTLPSLWPPPPPLNVLYIRTVCVTGGGGGDGWMLNCGVDHILQEFYTLFLARFRTYKIATPPQTNDQWRRH